MGLLKVDELLLHLDPVAESSQTAVAFNHTVTGKDDRDGIRPIGIPNGSKGLRMTDGSCDLLV